VISKERLTPAHWDLIQRWANAFKWPMGSVRKTARLASPGTLAALAWVLGNSPESVQPVAVL
jgi:hypothetical protein